MRNESREFIFLDRDGTINADRGFTHRWADWEFIEGAIEGLRLLRESGFDLVVVTNQSGIGRGYYSEDDVRRVHDELDRCLRAHSVDVSAFLFCPHAPEDDCPCRKPRTGMVDKWLADTAIKASFPSSWTIGDRATDVELGQALGTRTVLLTATGASSDALMVPPDVICRDLAEASLTIRQWKLGK